MLERLLSTRACAAVVLIRLMMAVVFASEGIQTLLFPAQIGVDRFARTLRIDICVAIVSTKIPIVLAHGFWGFQLPKPETYGWWSRLHEARTDLSMWCASLFLPIVGAGAWSLDARLSSATRTRR